MQLDPENSQNGGVNQRRNTQPPKLGRNQKIAVAVLGFFALFVIITWSIQFKKGLTSPFLYQESESENKDTAGATCTGPECAAREEAALKVKDTDKDGLTDWDELNAYLTSPYIEDSDSDGISDKEEIAKDKDPNCPEGRTCNSSGLSNPDMADETENATDFGSLEDLLGEADLLQEDIVSNSQKTATGTNPTTKTGISNTDAQKIMSGQMDAKSLRALLISEGFSKDLLNQMNDEQLLSSYRNALIEASE